MTTRRYRIHFIASFNRDVQAMDDRHAREIAEGFNAAAISEVADNALDQRLNWNTIRPIIED